MCFVARRLMNEHFDERFDQRFDALESGQEKMLNEIRKEQQRGSTAICKIHCWLQLLWQKI